MAFHGQMLGLDGAMAACGGNACAQVQPKATGRVLPRRTMAEKARARAVTVLACDMSTRSEADVEAMGLGGSSLVVASDGGGDNVDATSNCVEPADTYDGAEDTGSASGVDIGAANGAASGAATGTVRQPGVDCDTAVNGATVVVASVGVGARGMRLATKRKKPRTVSCSAAATANGSRKAPKVVLAPTLYSPAPRMLATETATPMTSSIEDSSMPLFSEKFMVASVSAPASAMVAPTPPTALHTISAAASTAGGARRSGEPSEPMRPNAITERVEMPTPMAVCQSELTCMWSIGGSGIARHAANALAAKAVPAASCVDRRLSVGRKAQED